MGEDEKIPTVNAVVAVPNEPDVAVLESARDGAVGICATTDRTAPYDALVASGHLKVANRVASSRRWYVLTEAGREALRGGANG